MKVDALYWKAPDESTRPRWLDGAKDVCSNGVYWWIGSPVVQPDFNRLEWLTTAKGWAVAAIKDLQPNTYLRDSRWANYLAVEDARGRTWFAPAILTPSGDVCVAQVRRRVDGEWVREYVDESQQAATEAAQAVRSGASLSLDEQCDAVSAIMETAYHIDADTLAVLGLLDDVLCVHALRMAAGVVDHG